MRSVGLQRGRTGHKEELGVITGQLRRMPSVGAVKAAAECLLRRLQQAGKGNSQAAKRREFALREEERIRREQEAHFVGLVRGTRLVRRGFFKVD